jgi:DNA processing protein
VASAEPSEREAWALLMSVDGLGPAAFGALLAAYRTGRELITASTRRGAAASFGAIAAAAQGRLAPDPGLGERVVAMAADAPARLAALRASGLRVLTLDDPDYPERLRAIDLPPPALLLAGDVAALSASRAVAIVGTRRPTERGRLIAARIGAAVAKGGAVVVSGLAVGIDGAAHASVVAEGRPTVAVLGSGHDRLYPAAHRRLATDIVATGGAVISELWPDREPSKNTFPQRNRVISGLADATIVVEAGLRSGALITADWALRQGRECYLVPGPIDEPRSAGCNDWLREFRDAVRLVSDIPHLVEDLGLVERPPRPTASSSTHLHRPPASVAAQLTELGPTARQVAEALIAGHTSIDDLVATTGHEPATVLGAITLLEMRGLVTSTYGRYRAAGRLASAVPGTMHSGGAAGPSRTAGGGRGNSAASGPGLLGRGTPC